MIKLALDKAKEVLKGNIYEKGIIAGREYYPDIWARDAFITSLGMSLSGDDELLRAVKLTIDSLASYQREESGQIPNKISPDGSKICFGEGGCVDSSAWYPMAVFAYYKISGDQEFLERHSQRVDRAIKWLIGLDQNNDFLIETNEGSDWMDLLLRAGRVLYDEVLFYEALMTADEMRKELGKEEKFSWFAEKTKENINLLFWPKEENLDLVNERYGYTGIEKDFQTALSRGEKDYYLAEVRFREVDTRCDVYANCLTILFGIADEEKTKKILSYFDREKVYEPYPVKSLWPPIFESDPDWNIHFRWTDIPRLSKPGNYHNGGIWPYIGGFYVLTLVKERREDAKLMLEKLAEANLKTDFNEWLDQNGNPGGSRFQSWSAGMYIVAFKSVEIGTCPLEL